MHRIVLSFLILGSILSCTKRDDSKDTLTLALEAFPNTLDPRFATDANGQRIDQLLFNSLVRKNPELQIVGDAAASWTYEKLTYRFILHPGIKFSNGRPLTKEDVLYSFRVFQSDKSPFQTNLKSIKSVEVDDSQPSSLTVILKLNEFNAVLLSDLSLVKLLPKSEIEKSDEEFTRNLVGTGSFKFLKKEDNSLWLEGRTDHPFAPPKIKKIEIKIIADDNTRLLKVQKGEIDVAQSVIPTSKIKELESNKDLIVTKSLGPSMTYMLLNLRDPVLKNLSMRQALNTGINRDEIIKYKMDGLGVSSLSILPPNNRFYNTDLKPASSPLERAQQIVAAHKFAGTELTLKTSNTQEVIEVAKVLANQIEKLGFKVKLQSYEWGTFFGDVKSGNFQMALLRWVGTDDPDIFRLAFHSKELPPGRNRGFYSNPLLDKMLDRGPGIERESERIDLYKKVQSIVLEDLPIIPLWHPLQISIVHKRVKGYVPPQNGDFTPLIAVEK